MLLTRRPERVAAGALGALAAVGLALLGATCDGGAGGGGEAPDAGTDGGADAGAVPVPRRDAGSVWRDAGPRDAGRDGGPDPVYRDAGLAEVVWERYPGLPEECVIERAEDPSQVYVSDWEPCPGAEDHCRQLAVDWAFRSWRLPDARSGNSHTGEYGYWRMRLQYPEVGSAPDVMVLATTRGAPLLAFTYHRCAMSTAMSEDTIVHQIADVYSSRRLFIYFGAPEEASRLDTPAAVIDMDATGVTGLQEPAVTPDQVVGVVQPGNFLFAVRRTGETRRVDALRPGSGIQTPQLVGEHLLWKEYGARWSVVHEAEDGTIEPYLEVPDADVRELKSDGTRMVWVQSYPPGGGSSYTRQEIWTAPYVRDPDDRTGARRLLVIDDQRHPLAGGRLRGTRYAFVHRSIEGWYALEYVDLVTAERRQLRLPRPMAMVQWVISASDHEAMVEAGTAGSRPLAMRVDLDRMPLVEP